MKQESISDMGYSFRKKKTKREGSPEIVDEIVPWEEWVALIVPHYPRGKRGRPPIKIETMLRMYLLHFRHLLEDKGIGKLFLGAIDRCLERAGRIMPGGAIVDATLISAPSSTKNTEKKRDPEMHSVKKGDQWHFGMKCHTCVDAGSGFIHTVEATAANVHDVTVATGLLLEDDAVVYGDSAYLGIEKRDEIRNSLQLSAIAYRIDRRPGRLPKVSDDAIDWERYIEDRKSSVRCKVDHPYRIVKDIFGFRKVVYRGSRKNLDRLHVLFASANLYMLA